MVFACREHEFKHFDKRHAILTRQSAYVTKPNIQVSLLQFFDHVRSAIDALAEAWLLLYLSQQDLIRPTGGTTAESPQFKRAEAKDTVQKVGWKIVSLLLNAPKSHYFRSAKNGVSFLLSPSSPWEAGSRVKVGRSLEQRLRSPFYTLSMSCCAVIDLFSLNNPIPESDTNRLLASPLVNTIHTSCWQIFSVSVP